MFFNTYISIVFLIFKYNLLVNLLNNTNWQDIEKIFSIIISKLGILD